MPRPVSSPARPPTNHVLLISVDGLHAADLARYIQTHPNSTLAALSAAGVTYPNASCTRPSNSFPGLIALVTGGSPKSAGVYYDDSYDRSLFPPVNNDTNPNLGVNHQPSGPGTECLYQEFDDIDYTLLNGGGGIDPNNLPQEVVNGEPGPALPAQLPARQHDLPGRARRRRLHRLERQAPGL